MKRWLVVFLGCLNFILMLAQQPTLRISRKNAEPEVGKIIQAKVWKNVDQHQTFYAPWSAKQDSTTFQCYFSPNYFYFRFVVPDQTQTLTENYQSKMDVGAEDRAELFISPTADMNIYYCAEIDPEGRAFDYSARYSHQFNYPWSFETLETETQRLPTSYIVAGRWTLTEWAALGINPDLFYMGVFRADFDGPKKVVWYSLLKSNRKRADFHIPSMLFQTKRK